MSNTWFCIPSARPERESTVAEWRKRGYKIALFRDIGAHADAADFLIARKYPGYALAVNELVREVLASDASCDWIVTGGDDVLPDPNKPADEIATECSAHFAGTFGVMQPTGDRWGDDAMGRARWPDAPAYIDRVAGSPWIGREYCERINGARGPIWPEYWHMFEDEEAQAVASRLGVFHQRRDLTHYHKHWMRDYDGDAIPQVPEFLREVSGSEHWQKSQELFNARKAAGFPGHEPI